MGLNLLFGLGLVVLVGSLLARYGKRLWAGAPVASGVSLVFLLAFAVLPSSDMSTSRLNGVETGVVNLGERLLGVGLIAAFIAVAETGIRPVRPVRGLALLALLGSLYLVVPAFLLAPRAASRTEFDDIVAEYYTDQRYFNTRPYQFIRRLEYLRSPAPRGRPPGLIFLTGPLVPRPSEDGPRPE